MRAGLWGLLAVIASIGLGSSVEGWLFLVPAVLGAAVAVASIQVSSRFDLLVGESMAVSAAAFVILAVLVGGGPTPTGVEAFANGLVHGWADWLSTSPPAVMGPELRMVPYTLAWLGATIAGVLTTGRANPILPAVGPTVTLILSMLLSIDQPGLGPWLGSVILAGALLASMLGSRERGLVAGVGMLVAVVLLTALVGPRLPSLGMRERINLREHQARPWNPLSEPSPLVTIKASLKESAAEEVVLVIESAEPVTRLNLAVLTAYSGSVWSVANEPGGGPSRFVPVDRSFPAGEGASDLVTFDLEVVSSSDPWLPLAGWPSRVVGSEEQGLYFNSETGTVAVPGGLTGRFEIQSGKTPDLSLAELSSVTAVANPIEDRELDLVPPSMRNLAGDLFEGVDPGMSRAVALSRAFVENGFYDHSEASRPGHSLARMAEFFDDPDSLVGFSEQYAAGAAVLARLGGLPARVVVGYQIPPDRFIDGSALVYAGDRNAWIEVDTVELGWVPINVTPDRSREPEENILGVSVQDVAIPNPPPVLPPPPNRETPADSELAEEADPEEDNVETGGQVSSQAWVVVGGAGLMAPIWVTLSAGLAVVWLKRRRSRRRRGARDPREQVAGAWRELSDRLSEVGVEPMSSSTPSETVAATIKVLPSGAVPSSLEGPVRSLALAVDRAAFGSKDPDRWEVEDAWGNYEEANRALCAEMSKTRRLCMVADPRPLQRRKKEHENG